jgi:hypothetical protein
LVEVVTASKPVRVILGALQPPSVDFASSTATPRKPASDHRIVLRISAEINNLRYVERPRTFRLGASRVTSKSLTHAAGLTAAESAGLDETTMHITLSVERSTLQLVWSRVVVRKR